LVGSSNNFTTFHFNQRALNKEIGAYVEDGVLINSGKFTNQKNTEVMEEITKLAGGKRTVNYKLKDWVFSRQRYWGEPIPLIHCDKCGVVAVPEKELPLTLPKVKSYEPSGTGESPLATIDRWVNTKCPKCKGKAKRETNTMPQWAGSSWYYLRYVDPKNKKALVDKKKEKIWSPVDMYVGGTEHATRHLIYARFWHKFLFDIGAVSQKEPFMCLKNQGMILGADGRKMSKRWGNVVNPDDVVNNFGADTLRVYEMFMAPFDQEAAWSTDNMIGSRRFLERVWKLAGNITKKADEVNPKVDGLLHRTIKKVTEDINSFNFNTAISAFMILTNEMTAGKISQKQLESLIKLLAPFAPHLMEEMWCNLGHKKSVNIEKWPTFDPSKIKEEIVTLAVQVNGRVRATISVSPDADQVEVEKMALNMPEIQKWLNGVAPKKVIYVKGRILNIVI
jgi:leucyl-tRNA synthetase